ncbi:hypothetical protein [Sulfitobacter sabulilitoris]|uniref:Thioredoxin family protein n=1 Tax=Sulfitobacter sabulilitoris TaxID=2562655 RepID=A0A5S3PFJ5_9RHOB|nr:hypothetical protein [Sulfitobacter sabulilitoris]TMM52840.1 hypothetical protein FDT80_11330 [Sulfitobacter sabulilitoris]
MHRILAALFSFWVAIAGTATFARAAELVMVEQHGCHWCQQWDAEISHIYPKTQESRRAPLRRVQLHDLPADIAFSSPPVFTPTFVLVDAGRELGRMEGYAGADFFWPMLLRLLDTHPDATVPQS